MLVGEQWLRDAGYSASLREIKLEEEDMDLVDSRDNLEIEVQLSPWVITRNFIQASQVIIILTDMVRLDSFKIREKGWLKSSVLVILLVSVKGLVSSVEISKKFS